MCCFYLLVLGDTGDASLGAKIKQTIKNNRFSQSLHLIPLFFLNLDFLLRKRGEGVDSFASLLLFLDVESKQKP